MNILKLIKSFRYAGKGLVKLVRSENNFQFHSLAACIALFCSWLLQISAQEFMIVCLCIALVMAAEAFNTSIEKLSDKVEPNFSTHIADIKDIAAAGVLITAIFAFVSACIIFIPKLLSI